MNRIITFEELEAEIQKQGSHLVFEGSIDLDMEELPKDIESITINNGLLTSDNLKVIAGNIKLNADYGIWFYNLSMIDNKVRIDSQRNINLPNLITIGDHVGIYALGSIYIPRLIRIGNNVVILSEAPYYIDNDDDMFVVFLEDLTTIGINIKIGALEDVYFNDITTNLYRITIFDGESVSDTVVQFFVEHDICLQVPQSSSLVALASKGVKVEIVA